MGGVIRHPPFKEFEPRGGSYATAPQPYSAAALRLVGAFQELIWPSWVDRVRVRGTTCRHVGAEFLLSMMSAICRRAS